MTGSNHEALHIGHCELNNELFGCLTAKFLLTTSISNKGILNLFSSFCFGLDIEVYLNIVYDCLWSMIENEL